MLAYMINDKTAFAMMNDEKNHIWHPMSMGPGDLDEDMQSRYEFDAIVDQHINHCN